MIFFTTQPPKTGEHMHLRRLYLILPIGLLFASGTAHAAAWHSFASKPLGFSVRFPSTWRPVATARPGVQEVQFAYSGATPYTLDVTILKLKGSSTARTLQRQFLSYEKRLGNGEMADMHWSPTRFAGRAGIGTVYAPATEGGTSVANGVYVVPWRTKTYVVTMTSVTKPTPKSLNQFPAVYKQMLATWKFL